MNEPPTTYRFGPREESGVFGLAQAQVLAVTTGAVLALVAVLAAHQPVAGLGLLALAGFVAFAPVAGRPLVTWLGPFGARIGRKKGATAPLSRHHLRTGAGIDAPARRAPVRWHLPGLGRLVISPVATYLGEVGVADVAGSRRSVSLTFVMTGPRFGLTDPDEQGRALGSWGQLLGALARDSHRLQRLQLTERLVPDDLRSQRGFLARVAATADHHAQAIYAAELESLQGRAIRHEVLLTVTLDRLGRSGFENAVATECDRLVELLDGAGFTARPLGTLELASSLRAMLDPLDSGLFDELVTAESTGGQLAAGLHAPRAWKASWGTICTDSGFHACFEASALPRLPVGPEWAWPLVLGEAPVTRRTLALHLELARPDVAIRRAERAVVSKESDEAMRARWGFYSGAREHHAHEAALSREEELASGFADARFALLACVSATGTEELETSCRALVSEAAQSHVELRRLYGRQSEALVASLPLGIIGFRRGWR
jgi:hypothetical protein